MAHPMEKSENNVQQEIVELIAPKGVLRNVYASAKAIEQYVIKASNKWIDVKDRLPEEYKTVLIVYVYRNGNSGYAVGAIIGKNWELCWSDDYPSNRDIKYWREMPSYDLAELKKGLNNDR